MTENKTVNFAFVCDEEVAWILSMPISLELPIAVMQSNPTIVEFDENENIQMGDSYKEGKFIKS
jgi:hypothetical protein